MLRWAVNIAKWEPTLDKFVDLLSYVQPEEQKRIRRFHFHIDKKRALAGRLLLRAAISKEAKLNWQQIHFLRTAKNKPYWQPPSGYKGASDFQVNISHHGDWVVLAAGHGQMLGCDVMSIEIPGRRKELQSFFKDMRSCFTAGEWRIIRARQGERAQLSQFFSFWTLKESVVKATGEGLGYDLQRVEFVYGDTDHTEEYSQYQLRIYPDSKQSGYPSPITDLSIQRAPIPQPEWVLEHTQLDANHIAAVARGPLDWTLDGATAPSSETEEVSSHQSDTNANTFEQKTVQDLLDMAIGLAPI